MLLHNSLLALTALTIGASALPFTATKRSTAAEPCPSTSLKADQSTAFGWQIAASTITKESLSSTCDAVLSSAAQKWAEQGLDLESIQAPVCDALTAPQATDVLPKVVSENTKIFETLITNAFAKEDTKAWGYLCENIRYKQLTGFLLDDATIVGATCDLARKQLAPAPFVSAGGATVNSTAVSAYKDAQSKLFAYMYASQASTKGGLDNLCADSTAPLKLAAWESLQLDGTCVKDTICGVKEPIDVDGGKEAIKEYTSKLFIAVIGNISNDTGYKKWLCRNLDESAMETVGMDGALIKGTICEEAE